MNSITRKRSKMTTDSIMSAKRSIRSYEYCNIKVRTVCDNYQIWMVFADVCKVLNYVNPNHQVKYISVNERKKVEVLAKNGPVNAINLSGLRRLCILSDSNDALDFLRWVEKEMIFDDYDGR